MREPDEVVSAAERIRLLGIVGRAEALDELAERLTMLAGAGRLDLYRRLLHAVKSLAQSDVERGVILFGEGLANDWTNRTPAAIQSFRRAADAFRTTKSSVLESAVLCQLGGLYQDQGDLIGAEFTYDRALELAGGEKGARGRVCLNQANLWFLREEYDNAIDLYMLAIADLGDANDLHNLAGAHIGAGSAYIAKNERILARDALTTGLQIAVEDSNYRGMAAAYGAFGNLIFQFTDDQDAAQQAFEAAQAWYGVAGDIVGVAKSLKSQASVEHYKGNAERFAQLYRDAAETFDQAGVPAEAKRCRAIAESGGAPAEASPGPRVGPVRGS